MTGDTYDGDGVSFGEKLLFVKWVDGDPPRAARAWVGDCPDGVDPRSEANPHTYTFEETFEDGWHEEDGDNLWYVVGAIDGWHWVGVDFDVGDDHAETIDFDPADVRIPNEGTLVASTPSGGLHNYTLHRSEPPSVQTNYDGIDLLSDSGNVRLSGAVSPWHDSGRDVLNDPEPIPSDGLFEGGAPYDESFTIEGEPEPIFVPRAESEPIADLDVPEESPDEVPHCIHQLLAVRSSSARYDYPDSPFAADTHLGMMMYAVGYSPDEALELLAEHPPAKDTGFDERETRYQLEMLYGKMSSGGMSPPNKKLMQAGIDLESCDCAVHGTSGRSGGTIVPRAMSEEGRERRDRRALQAARNNVRRTLSEPVEGGVVYHAPQGLGKTRFTPYGADEQPRLVITTNKGEHRETLKYFAEQAGVTYDEVVPFGDSWLVSPASPVADECMDLYRQGVMPKYILAEYQDVMPEDVECPYIRQFEDGPSDVDLLMGSPGHENVARFRKKSVEDQEDPVPRAVFFDDTNPADHELNKNFFTLDDARAGINELLQEIPQIGAESVTELLKSRSAMDAVERIALGDGRSGADDEPEPEGDDVWAALDAAASEDDAIRVDIVDVVRRRENVTGDTVIRLKIIAGAEIRGARPLSWSKDDMTYFSWVSHPNLEDHDVAVLSATHVPHVTEEWMAQANAGPAVHKSATDDWEAVRRAQGYTLLKTRSSRNSRSGAGAYHDDPGARRDRMQESREELVDAIERAEGELPGVVDAKKLLEDDGDSINFGRVWSNNRHRDKEVGLVAGATYFGDEWVEARAAYCGRSIDIAHDPGEPAYCDDEVGSDLLKYMTTTWVEQAATRFGRNDDIDEARVYIDTAEVPDGFPTIDISERIVRTTETQQAVYRSVVDGSETLGEIAEDVDVSRRQVSNVVWQLEEMGFLDIQRWALEYGSHHVSSGSSAIDLNIVELPEIDCGGEDADRMPRSNADGPATLGSPTVQSSLEFYGSPSD